MFDLITGRTKHLARPAAVPYVVSTSVQLAVILVVATLPLLYVTDQLPSAPTVMAFVAAPPPPAPPPPPPPPPSAPAATPKAEARAVPRAEPAAAPIVEPTAIAPVEAQTWVEPGVAGGVEGGIPGGIVGGVVGGLPEAPAPPPPPAPTRPVRIGGQIDAPALVHRVEPYYPSFAVSARIQGVVILEAIVDDEGQVAEVRVLRSVNRVLDIEAERAVRQWRYSPLVLNGQPTPFILTVTLSFHLESP